ncbi:MAG: alpha/beta hydrolase [Acidimicrobiia bacterium]|nr:alpha/beta hydrolase [Acidimicrobiia bacterium]
MMGRTRRGVLVLVVALVATVATACTGPFDRVFPSTDECHGFDRLTRCGQVRFTWMPGFDDPATPDHLDRVGVLAIGPASAHNVLVLNPGTSAGSAYFLPLAQDIVRATRGRWQVWSVERRENLLEDHSVLNLAKQGKTTNRTLFDYYLGWLTDPTVTDHFQLIPDSTVSYARGWGMNVEIEDLHRVVEAAGEHGRTVVLGGHSLGGSITTAYATWDFNGVPGGRDLAGLVYIDGGSNPTPVTPDQANLSLANLQTASPWLSFGGIPAPFLGLYSATGATSTIIDPGGASLGQTFALLPDNIKAPVPATNEAEFGFAIDANSSPPNLRAAQVHVGQLAASGDPRGWDRAGAISPIQRYATMLSGTGLRNLDGSAWYHPMRLTIDAGAVADGNANPAQGILDVKAIHGHDLRPNTLIYAFGAALGGQGVLDTAQVLAAQSGIPAQNLTLVNRASTYAHNDPAAASPQNDFLDGLIPFLSNVSRHRH